VKVLPYNTESALAQNDSFVAPIHRELRALIRSMNATGGNAADLIRIYPAGAKGETTVAVTAAAAATTVIVDADDNGADVNGNIITTSDFLLVNLDASQTAPRWQLFGIGGVSADAGNDQNTLSSLVEYDGVTGLRAALTVVAAAANAQPFKPRAYIIFAADVQTVNLATDTLNLEYVSVGHAGHPLALSNDGAAAAAHRMNGVIKYI